LFKYLTWFIGFSTLHFAQALREQGFGKIISIDAFDWTRTLSPVCF
jgi:predicted O-methyltransferase YrrM